MNKGGTWEEHFEADRTGAVERLGIDAYTFAARMQAFVKWCAEYLGPRGQADTEALYRRYFGHRWEDYWQVVR